MQSGECPHNTTCATKWPQHKSGVGTSDNIKKYKFFLPLLAAVGYTL